MKKNIFFIIILAIFMVIILISFFLFKNQESLEILSRVNINQNVFSTEEECISATNQNCDFQNCDYIPDGKTFEEVCGKDFKKGWVPVNY